MGDGEYVGHNDAKHQKMKGILGRSSPMRPGSSWRFAWASLSSIFVMFLAVFYKTRQYTDERLGEESRKYDYCS